HSGEKPPVTDRQFNRLVALIETSGETVELSTRASAVLGLTRGEETIAVRQIHVRRTLDGAEQKTDFSKILKAGDSRFIVSLRTDEHVVVFLTDSDRVLLAAAVWSAGEPGFKTW